MIHSFHFYIYYAPQGEALQQGTEVSEYVELHFASSEDSNDMCHKRALSQNVIMKLIGLDECVASNRAAS